MNRIRSVRKELGLTQKELAEKIESTSKNIWAYENNIATPPLDTLIRLADYFECSIDYLAGRENDFGKITIKKAPTPLSTNEQKLIDNYRKLNTTNKIYVTAYTEVRLEEQQSTCTSKNES